MEAALEPLAADEVVEEGTGFGGGGVVMLVVLVDEQFEIGRSSRAAPAITHPAVPAPASPPGEITVNGQGSKRPGWPPASSAGPPSRHRRTGRPGRLSAWRLGGA